jgi:hypothetical protein
MRRLSGGSYAESSGSWPWLSLDRRLTATCLSAIFRLFQAVLDVNLGAEAVKAIDLSLKATVAFLLRLDWRGAMLT